MNDRTVSVVIPTYGRDGVLVDTLQALLRLPSAPAEIVVVDQSPGHDAETTGRLEALAAQGAIRWLRLDRPSITRAMNVGLQAARGEIVLFLDDDIVPGDRLIAAHEAAHAASGCRIVAGRVVQPWDHDAAPPEAEAFRFSSQRPCQVTEVMGGNFSVRRAVALELGGFDENFVHVAYRFEAEFSARALAAGERIHFAPEASVRHLKVPSGGTRAYGEHLTTFKPSHAVGEYYFALRARGIRHRVRRIVSRPVRAVRTRHHLKRPWWILPTLSAEVCALGWAIALALRGPRVLARPPGLLQRHD